MLEARSPGPMMATSLALNFSTVRECNLDQKSLRALVIQSFCVELKFAESKRASWRRRHLYSITTY